MADNTYRSYRNRDDVAYDGDGVPARGPADPLAQLARLIGQNDPRNEFDHNVVADAAPQEWPADERYAEPGQVAEQGYRPTRVTTSGKVTTSGMTSTLRSASACRAAGALSCRTSVARRRLCSAGSAAIKQRARGCALLRTGRAALSGGQAPADYGQQLPAFATQSHDDYDYEDQEQDEHYARMKTKRRAAAGAAVLSSSRLFSVWRCSAPLAPLPTAPCLAAR